MKRIVAIGVMMLMGTRATREARADRYEAKAIPSHQIPLSARKLTCVLKMSVTMDLPTSFGGNGVKTKTKAQASISTERGQKDIDVDTLALTIAPKQAYPSQDQAGAVESGTVEVVHMYTTAAGIRSGKDVYQNSSGHVAISFRPDNSGHLALAADGERINLDFGTGLLQRVWNIDQHTWSVYAEAYACRADAR
jgi:hypothetical protein